MKKKPIVFFDAPCTLCTGSAMWIEQHAPQRFVFAPLEGPLAQETIPEEYRTSVRTVVVFVDQKIFVRSAAIARILWRMGGRWRFLGALLWLIPWPIRDLGYRIVAYFRPRRPRS